MESMLQALADPRRRQIVEALRTRPMPVGDLVQRLPIAQSGVSRHLRILKEAGIVQAERQGQKRIYSLCPEPFDELADWLEQVRQVWEQRLDNFEDVLEQHKRAPQSDNREGEE